MNSGRKKLGESPSSPKTHHHHHQYPHQSKDKHYHSHENLESKKEISISPINNVNNIFKSESDSNIDRQIEQLELTPSLPTLINGLHSPLTGGQTISDDDNKNLIISTNKDKNKLRGLRHGVMKQIDDATGIRHDNWFLYVPSKYMNDQNHVFECFKNILEALELKLPDVMLRVTTGEDCTNKEFGIPYLMSQSNGTERQHKLNLNQKMNEMFECIWNVANEIGSWVVIDNAYNSNIEAKLISNARTLGGVSLGLCKSYDDGLLRDRSIAIGIRFTDEPILYTHNRAILNHHHHHRNYKTPLHDLTHMIIFEDERDHIRFINCLNTMAIYTFIMFSFF